MRICKGFSKLRGTHALLIESLKDINGPVIIDTSNKSAAL